MVKIILRLSKRFLFIFFVYAAIKSQLVHGQEYDTIMVKYTRDFVFNEGIYMTFAEFKNNSPSIRKFTVSKDNVFGESGSVTLKYLCGDSTKPEKYCVVKDCFGYCYKGAIYINQGFEGYFYRVFILGALTHYMAFVYVNTPDMYISSFPTAYVGTTTDYAEFLLDFETGKTFRYTYREFSDFLKERDIELYNKLQATKQKRKMFRKFLLEYNERHPIYFPVVIKK